MAFTLKKPSSRCRLVPATLPASTAFAVGTLIASDAAGTGAADVLADATNKYIKGAIVKAVASTDSDYASVKQVMVLRDEDGIWEFDVGNGTADANDFGNLIDLHTDGKSVDVTASTAKQISVTKVKTVGAAGTGKLRGRIVLWA